AKGFTVSFAEPYFLDYRLALGLDLFAKQTTPYSYQSYGSETYGFGTRLGFPLREDVGLQLRYSLYRQSLSLSTALMNCNNNNPDFVNTFPTPDQVNTTPALTPPPGASQTDCYADGEASLAVKQMVLNGPTWTSMAGYSLIYNTLNAPKNATEGMFVEFKQDVAGLGGDVNFVKAAIDLRFYHEVFPDIIAIARGQAGMVNSWGGQDVRLLDMFFGGPWLVRGFAPNGFGPRDVTVGTTMDNVGG